MKNITHLDKSIALKSSVVTLIILSICILLGFHLF